MDTIIRDEYGVMIIATVRKTMLHLINTRTDLYSMEDIRQAINEQVGEEKEKLSRRMVQRAVVEILAESNK